MPDKAGRTARYWLIWAKAVADQMPKNKGICTHTYHAQGYREACNDIALALEEKMDELEDDHAQA